VAIGEVIEINDSLKHYIINDINNLSIKELKKSQDFISIRQDGFFKVLNGLSTLEEILRVIES
jgi:type IV pilus assembly protein PilB